MTRQWTKEQQAAIQKKGTLLVAAGAGSGKTAVLVARILSYVTDPVAPLDINAFLVVTYTKAAALEMKTRLREALEERLARAADPQESERFLTQLILMNRAQITTIHAFGRDILRRYFYLLGLEPNFRVLDEGENTVLIQEILDDLLEESYEKADPLFLKTAQFFTDGYRDQRLVKTLLELHRFAMSQPYPQAWLAELDQAYSWKDPQDFWDSRWGKALQECCMEKLDEAISELQAAAYYAAAPDGPREYQGQLEEEIKRLKDFRQLLTAGDGAAFGTAIAACGWDRLPAVNKRSLPQRDEATLDVWKVAAGLRRDAAKKAVKHLKAWLGEQPLADHLVRCAPMGEIVRTLAGMVSELIVRHSREKRRRNGVDFADLEHLPLSLLEEQPVVAEAIRERCREVLVDEYQDISPVQERLLQLVARPGHMFLVGDMKQSIYRFRMADPSLFMAKYRDFIPWESSAEEADNTREEAAEEDRGTVIALHHNFRSRWPILAAVNQLFRYLMREDTGEIAYDQRAELVGPTSSIEENLEFQPGPVEVHLVDRSRGRGQTGLAEGKDRDESGAESASDSESALESPGIDMETARLEAYAVAERLQTLIGEKMDVFDSREGCRPVRYKDVAILMRSAATTMAVYKEVFDEYNIPYDSGGEREYLQKTEVELTLALLAIIDNPHQDIPLLAVLRSFVVGLSAEELSLIRTVFPEGNYYEALSAAVGGAGADVADIFQVCDSRSDFRETYLCRAREIMAEASSELGERLVRVWDNLSRWRSWTTRYALDELVWRLYQETGIFNFVGVMPDGGRRQDNLRALYAEAVSFTRSDPRGLGAFLRFLAQSEQIGSKSGSPQAQEEFNQVHLMTTHASKGLEFPVVFLVGLGRNFNKRSLRGSVLLHKELGLGLPNADFEVQVRYPSLIQEAVRWVLTRETVAEEMRILYVGLTRAREKLILFATGKDFDPKDKDREAKEPVGPAYRIRAARSCLEWLEMAILSHPERLDPEIWQIISHPSLPWEKAQAPERMTETGEGTEKKRGTGVQARAQSGDDIGLEDAFLEELDRKLQAKPSETGAILKIGVTDLKNALQNPRPVIGERPLFPDPGFRGRALDREFKRPRFLSAQDTPLSSESSRGIESGTATHVLLQHIPWKSWSAWETWNKERRTEALLNLKHDLRERDLLTEEQEKGVLLTPVEIFLSSPLGKKLFTAQELLTETPFILAATLRDSGQSFLVQGVVDLIAVSDGRALVLDYKTDDLAPATAEQVLLNRYTLQMAIYCTAVQTLLNLELDAGIIYALRSNRAIAVPASSMTKVLAAEGLELRKSCEK